MRNRRLDYLHKSTTDLSKSHSVVYLEDRATREMTQPAHGTTEHPDTGVKPTAQTNRPTRDRFVCEQCGHRAHADLVGARNIKASGHAATVCGTNSLIGIVAQEPPHL